MTLAPIESIGTPYFDEVMGCKKPPFKMGAHEDITVTICSILPANSNGIKIILTEDANEVFVAPF